MSLAVLAISVSSVSFADDGQGGRFNGFPDRGQYQGGDHGGGQDNGDLDRRVDQLERQVGEMRDDIRRLQMQIQNLTPVVPVPPPVQITAACMISESSGFQTFLGTGRDQNEALFNARQACQTGVNAIFCSSAPRCDDNSAAPFRTHACMVTESSQNRAYRGVGRTLVEAEAKAKQSCQSEVNSIFCGQGQVSCD